MKDQFWGSAGEQLEIPLESRKKIADTPYENSSENDHNLVETSNNRIYFYSMVTRAKILKVNKAIQNINNQIQCRSVMFGSDSTPIRIHINSYGGSVFAGLSAVDYIKSSPAKVETIVEGCAASAASLMSVVGSHRVMHSNACILIHQLSGHMWGKFQEMKDDIENSEMLMNKIKKIYRDHCSIPEDVLENILKRDIWWDAETCLKYGLVDEIV